MASWAELKHLEQMGTCLGDAKVELIGGAHAAAYAALDELIARARFLQAGIAEHFQAEARATGIAYAADPLEPPLWVSG